MCVCERERERLARTRNMPAVAQAARQAFEVWVWKRER